MPLFEIRLSRCRWESATRVRAFATAAEAMAWAEAEAGRDDGRAGAGWSPEDDDDGGGDGGGGRGGPGPGWRRGDGGLEGSCAIDVREVADQTPEPAAPLCVAPAPARLPVWLLLAPAAFAGGGGAARRDGTFERCFEAEIDDDLAVLPAHLDALAADVADHHSAEEIAALRCDVGVSRVGVRHGGGDFAAFGPDTAWLPPDDAARVARGVRARALDRLAARAGDALWEGLALDRGVEPRAGAAAAADGGPGTGWARPAALGGGPVFATAREAVLATL